MLIQYSEQKSHYWFIFSTDENSETLESSAINDKLMPVTSEKINHLCNSHNSITIGNASIPFKQSVKNIGSTLNCHLTTNEYISTTALTFQHLLHHLTSIHGFLTNTLIASLLSPFVLSRIEYCS